MTSFAICDQMEVTVSQRNAPPEEEPVRLEKGIQRGSWGNHSAKEMTSVNIWRKKLFMLRPKV
jgi:hypothetical protein